MTTRRLFATLGLLLFGVRSLGAQQQTGAERNAAIQAVRNIYQEIEGAIKANRYVRHDTTLACGPNELEETFTFWRDSTGTVRRLDGGAGDGDLEDDEHYYYDAQGRLRFVFVKYSHLNGARLEERVYYDEKRQQLRHLRERTHGPAFRFGDATPLWNPAHWYKDLCSGG